MKKQVYILILCIIFSITKMMGQEINPTERLDKPETVSRTVKATESITLLPGFYAHYNQPFTALIVPEDIFDVVKGSPYRGTEALNWVSSSSYDVAGNLTSSGVSYFNTLGKPTQSHSLDIKTGKIWASETRYDAFNRPVFGTLSAPIGKQYGYKSDFIKTSSGSTFSKANMEAIQDNSATAIIGDQENTLGWYYSENNTSEKYQDITAHPYSKTIYSKLNPGIALKTFGGNKIKKTPTSSEEWLQSYSFTMPLAQELFYQFGKEYFPQREMVTEKNSMGTKPRLNSQFDKMYVYTLQENCTETVYYKVHCEHILAIGDVYKMTVHSKSSPISDPQSHSGFFKVTDVDIHYIGDDGDIKNSDFESNTRDQNVLRGPGGNIDINGTAFLEDTQEVYGCPLGIPYYIKGNKTVVRDVNGVENVVFKDSNGNVLAAARSGNEDGKAPTPYEVVSPIGKQGFVDIHIPVGCGGTVNFVGKSGARFKIYNLITDAVVSGKGNVTGSTHLNEGMYRVQVLDANYVPMHPFITYRGTNNNTIELLDTNSTVGVKYKVNYYDYSLNYYDKANRLVKSTQPLSKNLESTFTYNTLGQLLETSSPDEGKAEFKYRKDGQIRFSQNDKQKLVNEFSYTNYDSYGRLVESGVGTGTFSTLNPDVKEFTGSRKEQLFIVYDEPDTPSNLEYYISRDFGPEDVYKKYKQKFVAGNVSKTYSDVDASADYNATWYSYDAYGRVTWIVQLIKGLGVKTIDYEYDFAKGQVTKVIYQKHHNQSTPTDGEYFEHKYTYNVAGELFKVETSTDGINYKEQAKYKYYETGALKRVEVAENVQGIDYIYNLSGQLKAINHPSRSSSLDPGKDGTNGMPNDLFGFAIDYYNGDYTRTNTPTPVTSNNALSNHNQYNGNIKATRWSTASIANGAQASQVFSYNKNNWLTQANFGAANNNGTITANTYGNYKVYGLEYDANGNIAKLNRNKDGNTNNAMDRMTYHYKTAKPNQLDYIDDTVNANVEDIKDQAPNNYVYNEVGQLIENKGEMVKYVYNASGLVTQVLHNDKVRVQFDYNDKGFRVKKIAYTTTGVLDKETYYIRDVAGIPMAIVTPKTGRTNKKTIENPIYGASRLGVFDRIYQSVVYQLTDHLGNVRSTVLKKSNGQVITAGSSATDYYPFGMPMPNRQIINGEPYRYTYQGQEKDPETGKEAFQLRIYDARIGRWLTPDPKNEFHSPYLAMGNNPVVVIDPDGGMTTCPDPPCGDTAYDMVNTEIVITGKGPGSSGWDNFISNLKDRAAHTGMSIAVFFMNAGATHVNNNVTFGTYQLPDAATYGEFELSARMGRLAGNISSIIQGAGEDFLAVGGELVTVGFATPVSVPLAIHGTAVGVAGSIGTGKEIAGLINYFGKGKHNKGNQGNRAPKRAHNSQKRDAEAGEPPRPGKYQGIENKKWRGADYWYVKDGPSGNRWRIYRKKNSKNQDVWGWTENHHEKGQIHLFPGYTW